MDTLERPGFFRRIAAICYDSFLVFALAWAVTAVFIGIRVLIIGEENVRSGGRALQGGWNIALIIAVILTVYAFYSWFWLRNGQTLGMQAWRIRLDNSQTQQVNQRISLRQSAQRFLGAILSCACLGLGFFWILADPNGLSWHDRLSHSHLVLLPKKTKA